LPALLCQSQEIFGVVFLNAEPFWEREETNKCINNQQLLEISTEIVLPLDLPDNEWLHCISFLISVFWFHKHGGKIKNPLAHPFGLSAPKRVSPSERALNSLFFAIKSIRNRFTNAVCPTVGRLMSIAGYRSRRFVEGIANVAN
jgi:hypothetical protein